MSTEETKPTRKPRAASISEKASAGNTALALVTGNTFAAPVGIDPSRIKVKAVLSRPVLQCSKEGQQVAFTIISAMRQAEPLEADMNKDGTLKKQPPTIADVRSLQDGRDYTFLFAAIVKNEIERAYPNGSDYVGKSFAVAALGKPEGQKFRRYEVIELEIADAPAPAVSVE